MNLPDLAWDTIVRKLDSASLGNLRLTGRFGFDVVRNARETAHVRWGGEVARTAVRPDEVKVVADGAEAFEATACPPTWLLAQWPDSATRLTWDCLQLGTMPQAWISWDPRIRHQKIIAHQFDCPDRLPPSVDEVVCNVLSPDGSMHPDDVTYPFVERLVASYSECFDTSYRTCFRRPLLRFRFVKHLYLSESNLVFRSAKQSDILQLLWPFCFLETLTLKGFAPDEDGEHPHACGFPNLRALALMPRLTGTARQAGIPSLDVHRIVAESPALETLVMRGTAKPSLALSSASRLHDITFECPRQPLASIPECLHGLRVSRLTYVAESVHVTSLEAQDKLVSVSLVAERVFGLCSLFAHPKLEEIVLKVNEANAPKVLREMPLDWSIRKDTVEICEEEHDVLRLRRALRREQKSPVAADGERGSVP